MPKYRFDQIAINSTEKKKPTEEDRFTYLGLEHLDSGSLKVTRFGSDVAPIGEKLVMREGDVLFGKRRAYQKKVAIAPFDGIFSAHGMVLRPREDVIDKDFFPLFISSDYFLDAAIKISVGSLSPTINWRDLRNLEFNLPPLEEQRKLAKVLWAMNNTMEAYKNLIKATEDLVKSQFIALFGDWKTNSNGFPQLKLGKIADVGSSKRVFVSELQTTGVPFYRGTEIGALATGEEIVPDLYITEDHYETLKKSTGVPAIGDLLMPSICPDGRIWQVNSSKLFYFKDGRVLWIHLKNEALNSTYLQYLLKNIFTTDYESIASGTTFIELKIFSLKDLSIMVPKIELQKRFELLVKQSDKSKFELEQALAELTATYKRIIAENLG